MYPHIYKIACVDGEYCFIKGNVAVYCGNCTDTGIPCTDLDMVTEPIQAFSVQAWIDPVGCV
jgi:hypothetical protein